jgi:hypothetical protein
MIRFSRADHPRKIPRPGHVPMVLKAQIGGYDIGRVFMDAGSGINLIYARTLKAMSISLEWLKPTDCSFHGIVSGSANHPLGKIELDVCFGDSDNFRREKLEFEVMDWPSQYHAILGWPAFAKFMAVPHYAYLALKRPLLIVLLPLPLCLGRSFARTPSMTCGGHVSFYDLLALSPALPLRRVAARHRNVVSSTAWVKMLAQVAVTNSKTINTISNKIKIIN